MAVDGAPAKELRLLGLADWTIGRFTANRTILHKLQYEATRLREKPMLVTVLVVCGANLLVFWSLAHDALAGTLSLARLVAFSQIAVGTSLIAFGELNWSLDGAAAPVGAVLRLERAMAPAGAPPAGSRPGQGSPGAESPFPNLT